MSINDEKELMSRAKNMHQRMESALEKDPGMSLTQMKQSGVISQKERVAALWEQAGETDHARKVMTQNAPQAIQLDYGPVAPPAVPEHLRGTV